MVTKQPEFTHEPPPRQGWYFIRRQPDYAPEPAFFTMQPGSHKWVVIEREHADSWDDYVKGGARVNHHQLEPQ